MTSASWCYGCRYETVWCGPPVLRGGLRAAAGWLAAGIPADEDSMDGARRPRPCQHLRLHHRTPFNARRGSVDLKGTQPGLLLDLPVKRVWQATVQPQSR